MFAFRNQFWPEKHSLPKKATCTSKWKDPACQSKTKQILMTMNLILNVRKQVACIKRSLNTIAFRCIDILMAVTNGDPAGWSRFKIWGRKVLHRSQLRAPFGSSLNIWWNMAIQCGWSDLPSKFCSEQNIDAKTMQILTKIISILSRCSSNEPKIIFNDAKLITTHLSSNF